MNPTGKEHANTHLLVCGSSETMDEIEDGSVTLTVTSPPYWNAIDYDVHARDGADQWYRSRQYAQGFDSFEQYLDLMDRVFAETLRKTRPGGACAIVVGTVLNDGNHIPLPHILTDRIQNLGWIFGQDIIWNKTTGGVKRAGSAIQNPYPGYYYPNIMTEYILVFRKEGPPIEPHPAPHPLDFPNTHLDDGDSVWHIAPVPPQTLEHPCPFPEEIPHRLILRHSGVGDLVLDPFLGSGQTTKVAVRLDRRAAGYDLQPEYVQYATRRMWEPLHIRKRQLQLVLRRLPAAKKENAVIDLPRNPAPTQPEPPANSAAKSGR